MTPSGLVLAVLLAAPVAAWAGEKIAPACPPATEIDIDAAPLPNAAAGLKPGGTLAVLVLDSAGPKTETPAGGGAAPEDGSFPGHMARMLEHSVPGLHVVLTTRGRRGMTAADALDILRAELRPHRYQLVVWQAGTIDAVQGEPTGDFYQTLADGAALTAEAGADLVLVDPQYSHFLEANANVSPYLSAMQAVGAMPNTVLFHRFDLMRDWEDAGLIDLEHAGRAQRAATAARLRACLGQELARTLLADIAASQ